MGGSLETARWEYRGRYLDGASSDRVAESEALDSFTLLQLDTFQALWKPQPAEQQGGPDYPPSPTNSTVPPEPEGSA